MKKQFFFLSSILLSIYFFNFFNPVILKAAFYSNTNFKDNIINRWEFQKLCRFSYDPFTGNGCVASTNEPGGLTFDPLKVAPGDIIFVRNPDKFFQTLHPLIQYPYIIISHGHCADSFKKHFVQYLKDPKIIAWFGIHPEIRAHPKFHPLPLGVFQEIRKKRNKIKAAFEMARKQNKNKLLFMDFLINTYPKERQIVYNLFKNKHYCTIGNSARFGTRISFFDYIKELSIHKFALSPRGGGIDTYRTWETLLAGSIPIVKSSNLDSLYADLPILIVYSWTEITQEFLDKKYTEMKKKKYNMEKLFIGYWKNQIFRIRDNFLLTLTK